MEAIARKTAEADHQSDKDHSLKAENDDLAAAETREAPSDNVQQGTLASAQQGTADTETKTTTESRGDTVRNTRPLESGNVTKTANQTETLQIQTVNQNSQASNNSTIKVKVKVKVQQSTTGLVDQSLTRQIQPAQDTKARPESAARKDHTLQQSNSQVPNSIGKETSASANTGQATQKPGAVNPGSNQKFNSNSGQNNNGKPNITTGQGRNIGAASTTTGVNTSGGFSNTLATTSNAKIDTTNPPGKQKPATRVTVADQVNINIKKGAEAGADRITVKLNPFELGRVEIKLETNDQGLTRALVAAERPETLELLQRDARVLEKALQESGLKTDGNSLNFNLQQGSRDGETERSASSSESPDEKSGLTEAPVASTRGPSHNGDLDISI